MHGGLNVFRIHSQDGSTNIIRAFPSYTPAELIADKLKEGAVKVEDITWTDEAINNKWTRFGNTTWRAAK